MNTTAKKKFSSFCISWLIFVLCPDQQLRSYGAETSFKRLEKPRLEPKNRGIQVDSLTITPEKLIAVGPPEKLIAVDPAFDTV